MPDPQTAVPVVLAGRVAETPSRAARRSLPAPALRVLSDERLARLASSGDRAAFGAIFNRYHQELHRYCVSILRNAEDAGDALQSTMLRALNALEGDDREIALRPWLYRIAHNEAITLVRRRRRAAQVALPAACGGDGGAEVRADLRELLGDLRELPERQRGALVMRELGGLDFGEIAAAFDTTPSAAKQATYDARCTLHELAKGREMACAVVTAAISDGDGRALRGRAVRAHLRACSGCRSFRDGIAGRQAKLAGLAPTMPSAAAAGLLESVAGAGAAGGSGAGLVTGVGVPFVAKSLATVALVAALGAGAMRVTAPGHRAGPARPERSTRVPAPVPAHARHRPATGRRVNRPSPVRAGGAHKASGRTDPRPDTGSALPGRDTPGRTGISTPAIEHAPPVATTPAPAQETDGRRRLRNLGSGDNGGNHPIRRGVSAVIGRPDLPAAVDQIRDALPVKVPPPPPRLPKQRKRLG